MINSFIFSINATLPIFLIILLGKVLQRIGIFTREFASLTDKFVFRAALPLLLFKDMAQMNFREDFDTRFVLFCASVSVIMFIAVWGFSALLIKDKSMVGAFSQGSARGSAAILGIALATSIYGSSGHAPLMVLASVPVFNIMSVIILSFSSNGTQQKLNIKKILLNIITNPIILGIAAGVFISLCGITLPHIISETVSGVAKTATPMALLAIGASFNLSEARRKFSPALVASFIKLFLLPAIFLPIAIILGFRESALASIFVMLGSPTTVTCYIMSKNMNGDHVLSANIVMLATLLSSVSVTFWVFILKYFSLI